MKSATFLKIAFATVLAATAATAATSYESAYVESYKGRTDIPVPVSVVVPELARGTEGSVNVKFVVDETGTPRNIAVVSATDSNTASLLTEAVSAWKFNPAVNGGKPVAKTVILPFKITSN